MRESKIDLAAESNAHARQNRIVWVDRAFPDGTIQGEIRKIVTVSLRIVTEEGVRSYFRKARERIKRKQFKIPDPLRERTAYMSTCLRTDVHLNGLTNETLLNDLKQFVSTRDAKLNFPAYTAPEVSIIMVTCNKVMYTYKCLRNMLTDSLPPYEVIIVDNASSDQTPVLLNKLCNAMVIRNDQDQSFSHARNQGARASESKYLLFLSNDAFVHPGCISWLVKTIDSKPDIGAVGAKLVLRDGRLQEAGSIIWRDGSVLGYGEGDDPSKPEYCYARDVDYCSVACLIVRRDIFEKLGGFDEAFSPAYYEDIDLCMRLWHAGFRVTYQPMAIATRIEFAGNSSERAIRLMEKQRLVFAKKHEKELKVHLPFSASNVIRARDRRRNPTVLVIDDCVPRPEEGSGFPRMFAMLRSMASLGYRVALLPMTDATAKQPETDLLTQMGVEVLWGTLGVREVLQQRRDCYDIVIISRPHNALLTMKLVRETNPKARLVYDAEALWYMREQLRRSLGLPPVDSEFESKEVELSIMHSADYVIAVSEKEKQIIEGVLRQEGKVVCWGHPHPIGSSKTPFEERPDLLFVGGFKSFLSSSAGPNDDAILHFTKVMFPKIREKISGCKLIVVGSNVPKSIRQLSSNHITVAGYVKDLAQLYDKCRLFIAPMRFGAGTMWKVTEAMSHGLPCVLSTVAAQGVRITDGEEALVARNDQEFVQKTIQLYRDASLWNHVRKRELEYISQNCDPTAMERELDRFLKEILVNESVNGAMKHL